MAWGQGGQAMKAIIQAYSPEEIERIARGEQTIKVRKTAPKDTPFKVYMYCTKERMTRVPSMYAYLHKNEPKACAEYGTIVKWGQIGDVIVNPYLASKHVSYGMHGKVVGYYVCDKVIKYDYQTIACAKYEVNGADVKEQLRYNAGACLNSEEMYSLSNGKDLRGLHIPAVEFYDKPKELGEFMKPCVDKYQYCQGCKHGLVILSSDEEEYALYHGGYYDTFDTVCTNRITHPPRGIQYVEEL